METLVEVNGMKKVIRSRDPKLSDLKKELPEFERKEDFFVKGKNGKVRPLKDDDKLQEGEEIVSHKPIGKAA